MKIIYKTLLALVLAIMLTACGEVTMNSSVIATESVETALVQIQTALAETESAVPTDISTASPIPTFVLPAFTFTPAISNSSAFVPPPEAKLDYAMLIGPQVYNLLPYMSEFGPSGGEYSGCVDSSDFRNAVYYGIEYPLDTVTGAFDKYFQQEKWIFTEATTKMVGEEIKVPEVSYDVYRTVRSETPAFERLEIFLRDESSFRGKDYIDVRLFLTHIETKGNVTYLGDFYCGFNNHWLWIRITK